jgi:hypothetical protein
MDGIHGLSGERSRSDKVCLDHARPPPSYGFDNLEASSANKRYPAIRADKDGTATWRP